VGEAILFLRAASPTALSKLADQPAANSFSGLAPMRAEPEMEGETLGLRSPLKPRNHHDRDAIALCDRGQRVAGARRVTASARWKVDS